ncbi:MAG: insulinase family protein [Alphaproteobacteria bacterium]|nr:insulinase family protein [Alphaproteobacteria bacterium]
MFHFLWKSSTSFKVGQVVSGFKVIQKEKIQSSVGGIAYLFEHEKTKAPVLYVSNNDKHKAFTTFFRAPTTDSTGVSHIMEHSVLAGSEKYQGKDPFFEYFQTSPHSFMNAMTFQDVVWYPFSTQYDQNFTDLMDIYLDSIYHPLLKKETFMREGWRYGFDAEKNLTVNGVVYNEMKEAYSHPGRSLYVKGLEALFGQVEDSGGRPENIPDLSYEAFKAYHDKHYHPSNSLTYFYGNGNIKQHLSQLNKVFNDFDFEKKSTIVFDPVKDGGKVFGTYPAGKGETKSYATFVYSFGKDDDFASREMLKSLTFLLVGHEEAPLKKAFLDSGYATDISLDFVPIKGQLIGMIEIEGIPASKQSKIEEFYHRTLTQIAQEGFDPKVIQGVISSEKFNLKKQRSDYGLYYHYEGGLLNSFLQGSDVFKSFHVNDIYQAYEKQASQKHAFETLIQDKMLGRGGFALLKPDSKWVEKQEKELKQKLKIVQNSLSKEALDVIQSEMKQFKESEEKEENSTPLPNMVSSGMPEKVDPVQTTVSKIQHAKLFFHPLVEEGDLVTLRTYFDFSYLPPYLISYLGLFQEFLARFSPEGQTLEDFVLDQKIQLGKTLSSDVSSDGLYHKDGYSAQFLLGGTFFPEALDQALSFQKKILFDLDFSDKKKVKKLINRLYTEYEMRYRQEGRPILDRITEAALLSRSFDGFGFYLFLKDFNENFDARFDNMQKSFAEIRTRLFVQDRLSISIVAPQKSYDRIQKHVNDFVSSLPQAKETDVRLALEPFKQSEAVVVPKRTQQNYMLVPVMEKVDPKEIGNWQVLSSLIRGELLLPEIRFKNGAYTTNAQILPRGQLLLYSAADPKLKESYDTFNRVGSFLKKLNLPASRFDGYKVKLLASFSQPETPSQKAGEFMERTFQELNFESRNAIYEAIRDFSQDEIKNYADVFDKNISSALRATKGNKEMIEENKDLFQKIYQGGQDDLSE